MLGRLTARIGSQGWLSAPFRNDNIAGCPHEELQEYVPVAQETAEYAQPLTVLAEDEAIFRDSVREFAEAQVRPLVREMDEHARIPRALINQLFDLGAMGFETAEIDLMLDGQQRTCRRNDVIIIPRGVKHAFTSATGAVIEEISSAYSQDDSYYSDSAIRQDAARKTYVTNWMD